MGIEGGKQLLFASISQTRKLAHLRRHSSQGRNVNNLKLENNVTGFIV